MDVFSADARAYERVLDLPPRKRKGWVHEVEVPMRQGEALTYESEHAAPGDRVAFNVHSHQGPEVTYHVQGTEARVDGTFAAPWEGKFYLMWENRSEETVQVRVRAQRT